VPAFLVDAFLGGLLDLLGAMLNCGGRLQQP
jgi:hypothetical protein